MDDVKLDESVVVQGDTLGPVGRLTVRLLTAVVVIEFAMLGLFSYATIRYHMDIFKDFDVELPGPTLLIIRGENLIPVLFGVVAVVAGLKDLLVARPLDRLAVNLGLFVFGFVTILILWWGLYLPMVKLVQGFAA